MYPIGSVGLVDSYILCILIHKCRYINIIKYTSPMDPLGCAYRYIPRKSKSTKLCPLVGLGILNPWIILETVLCLVLDFQGVYIYIHTYMCIYVNVYPPTPRLFRGGGEKSGVDDV